MRLMAESPLGRLRHGEAELGSPGHRCRDAQEELVAVAAKPASRGAGR
ncbi:hypothetical protein FHU38_000043 [Saccharomonospora amisosensis]|uniref:Uncharacterized protein n=2 Tax=Saccharomonospora TaxID=1851 RepID=H5X750_9PSEU|nr:hypothetical protein SacmaDRAFT_5387 [Saccharomonospora marina XMU15]NIJ09699.1 hypothetical protein [Saccharomonospora amisosensis]TWE23626.1 hypothetical protein FHX69_4914 [Prauserella muralis]